MEEIGDRSPVAFVTGATSGIGRVLARRLAESNYRVIVGGRDVLRCRSTVEMIRARTGRTGLEVVVADLSRIGGIRDAAQSVMGMTDRLDLLVNNAGAVYEQRVETPEGLERTFALNVLAPYLLTTLLQPALARAGAARVVMVGSSAHKGASLDVDDLQGRRRYSGFQTYSRSKLALLLLTHEFARRWAGSGICVNVVHPGFVRTGFGRNNPGGLGWGIRIASVFALSVERGAVTPFYVCTSPALATTSGRYFVRGRSVRSSPASYDELLARRVWAACERAASSDPAAGGTPPAAPMTVSRT
ncbi:MAG: SDR family oxidoreductase [Thermoplasmata archaeon]|nr:SDR family oxidoreductase [Thermoplasmata archaeon]